MRWNNLCISNLRAIAIHGGWAFKQKLKGEPLVNNNAYFYCNKTNKIQKEKITTLIIINHVNDYTFQRRAFIEANYEMVLAKSICERGHGQSREKLTSLF